MVYLGKIDKVTLKVIANKIHFIEKQIVEILEKFETTTGLRPKNRETLISSIHSPADSPFKVNGVNIGKYLIKLRYEISIKDGIVISNLNDSLDINEIQELMLVAERKIGFLLNEFEDKTGLVHYGNILYTVDDRFSSIPNRKINLLYSISI